jgi:hypothetical protein
MIGRMAEKPSVNNCICLLAAISVLKILGFCWKFDAALEWRTEGKVADQNL